MEGRIRDSPSTQTSMPRPPPVDVYGTVATRTHGGDSDDPERRLTQDSTAYNLYRVVLSKPGALTAPPAFPIRACSPRNIKSSTVTTRRRDRHQSLSPGGRVVFGYISDRANGQKSTSKPPIGMTAQPTGLQDPTDSTGPPDYRNSAGPPRSPRHRLYRPGHIVSSATRRHRLAVVGNCAAPT